MIHFFGVVNCFSTDGAALDILFFNTLTANADVPAARKTRFKKTTTQMHASMCTRVQVEYH